MLRLAMIGPPGAGKGTQAERLIDDLNLQHLSTGDILRQAIKAASPLGLAARNAVDQGALVPDEIVVGLVRSKLEERRPGQGFVLDGFPRTINQANST